MSALEILESVQMDVDPGVKLPPHAEMPLSTSILDESVCYLLVGPLGQVDRMRGQAELLADTSLKMHRLGFQRAVLWQVSINIQQAETPIINHQRIITPDLLTPVYQ